MSEFKSRIPKPKCLVAPCRNEEAPKNECIASNSIGDNTISKKQIKQLLSIAESQVMAADVLMDLSTQIRTVVEDVRGPEFKPKKWITQQKVKLIPIVLLLFFALLAALVYKVLYPTPVPTWFGLFAAFAKRVFCYNK